MKKIVLQVCWFGVGKSKSMHWSILLLGFLVLVLLGGKGSATAAETSSTNGPPPDYQWQVGVAPTYTSGTYGTDSHTNIFYLPFSVKRLFRDGDITLVIPYVHIESTGAVRLVGGVGTRTSNSSGNGALSGGTGKGKKVTDTPQDTASSSSGLGDVILRGRYYLVEETSIMPLIALTARIKMPTADAGLGTGEFDEGVGMEFTKKLSERWRGFLDGGYTFIGDPEGVKFRNQWWYDIGAGYDVNKNWNLSLYYEEYRAVVTTVNNARDLFFSALFKPTSALRCTTSFMVGLSNGAPNYGLTAGLSYRF